MEDPQYLLPYLGEINGSRCLFVDGDPYWIRGGEIKNSCSANAAYMEKHVWPYVTGLGLNTLLVPLAWESVEPEEGKFDFSLPAQLIDQARGRGLRLVMLWFGLWKNGQSSYVPLWVKEDQKRYFRNVRYPRREMHTPICSVSPVCEAAVEKDAEAFSRFMAFLKEYDRRHTVICVQVENEVGLLGSERDYSPQAEALFQSEIPQDVAQSFGVTGTWQQAFGNEACAQFMSWCYASAVGRIAAAGADVYPLPMYVNAWTVQYPGERPGSYPAGGPVAEYAQMWRLKAPALQWMNPDIYLPDFAGECGKYAKLDQPLFVPEAVCTPKAAAFGLYLAGQKHSLGFSPYAIEHMGGASQTGAGTGIVQEVFQQANRNQGTMAGDCYLALNRILEALWPTIARHRGQGHVRSFVDRGTVREGISMTAYDFRITYHAHPKEEPDGGGLLIELSDHEFLLAARNCTAEVYPKPGSRTDAEFLYVDEMGVEDGRLVLSRRLNGDDQWLGFHGTLQVFRFAMHLKQ